MSATADLCRGSDGRGDGPYPHDGEWPVWFTCGHRATPPKSYPCTGSKHVAGDVVTCSCACHRVLTLGDIDRLRQPVSVDPAVVWRDQCNGRTLTCVNCGKELGGRHDVLCYAYAIERTKARRAAESGGSTETADREPPSTAHTEAS